MENAYEGLLEKSKMHQKFKCHEPSENLRFPYFWLYLHGEKNPKPNLDIFD